MAAVGQKRKRSEGADEEVSTSAASSGPVFTVYIEGLPYTSSEDDIREFFLECGDPTSIRAPRYQDSGRLMGYAHVDFPTKAAATKALSQDGKSVGGRYIKVAIAKPAGAGADSLMAFSERPRPKGCATVFIKGIPYDSNEEAVKAAFGKFGTVTSVRLARWNHTERLKGFGYVSYEHGFSAEAAVKAYREGLARGSGKAAGAGKAAEALMLGGRMVHLDYETGAPKQSFKTGEGKQFFKTEEAAPIKKALKTAEHRPAAAGAGAGAGAGSSGDAAPAPSKSKRARHASVGSEEDGGARADSAAPKASSKSKGHSRDDAAATTAVDGRKKRATAAAVSEDAEAAADAADEKAEGSKRKRHRKHRSRKGKSGSAEAGAGGDDAPGSDSD
jgi:RNA recognition motif-containing protein